MASSANLKLQNMEIEWFECSCPELLLVVLARMGCGAALVSQPSPLLAVCGGEGRSSASYLIDAASRFSFPVGFISRRVAAPALFQGASAAKILNTVIVETRVTGALLAAGWSHVGGYATSTGSDANWCLETGGLWTRATGEHNEHYRQAVNLALTVDASQGATSISVLAKGGIVNMPPPEIEGSIVYVTPSLTPVILGCALGGNEAILDAHDTAFARALNMISPTATTSWVRVFPQSDSVRTLFGVQLRRTAEDNSEEEESDFEPSTKVPRASLFADVVGLRASSRENGVSVGEALVNDICTLQQASAATLGQVSYGEASFGATLPMPQSVSSSATLPTPPSASPSTPRFMKASTHEARIAHSSALGTTPSFFDMKAVGQTPKKATPLSAFLEETASRRSDTTVRSAGDVLRATGGISIARDGRAHGAAPPSAKSACWLARSRPDVALSLKTTERGLHALALWPLTRAEGVAPVSVSVLFPLRGASSAFLAHFEARADPRASSKAAPHQAVRVLTDPSLSSEFSSSPYKLGIREDTVDDILRRRQEEEAFNVAAGCAPKPDEREYADSKPVASEPDGGGEQEVGDVSGNTTRSAPKKQKLAAAKGAPAPSASEHAAAAAALKALADAVAAVADDEVALGLSNVAALKAFLRLNGLAVSGTKAVLLQRVLSRPQNRAKKTAAAPFAAAAKSSSAAAAAPVAAAMLRFAKVDDDDDL